MTVPLFLFFALLVSAGAKELVSRNLPEGSMVRIIAPFNGLPSNGFFPVGVEVENKSQQTLSFQLESSCTMTTSLGRGFTLGRRRTDNRGEIKSVFNFSCPADENRSFAFLLPVGQANGRTERSLSMVLKEAGSDRFLASTVVQEKRAKYYFGYSTAIAQLNGSMDPSMPGASKFDPKDLPADWRAYAGYDGLALTQSEYQALSISTKLTLKQWVRSGGHLLMVGWGEGRKSPQTAPDASTIVIDQDFADFAQFRLKLLESLEKGQNGFGCQTVLELGRNLHLWKPSLISLIFETALPPINEVHDQQYLHSTWPVSEELGSRSLGTGLVLFGLMIFAILVGPINLFVWAKATRRHRLFVTTPLISLAASLIMIGLIILSDGFGGEGTRAIAIDVGSPDDKTAIMVQEQFSRSGILFSSGFTLDDQSVMNPLRPRITELNQADSAYSTGTFELEISPQEKGWAYAGNLFESRSEQAQLIRSVMPSRQGLSLISPSDATPKLASSFPYALGPVFYTDATGAVWTTDTIAPGESVALQKSDDNARSRALDQALSRFGESYRQILKRMFQRKNSFAALATEAPGVDTHPSIDWRKSPVVVTGLTAPK